MIGWTLCSGIGAPEMAAPWVDWRLASEIEPFPRAVLQDRFGYKLPEDHNQGDPLLWGDMTEVTPELARKHGVPLPDLLVAGTPCQAFSIAGLRGGTDDARGNLTLKFVETCHAIVNARPDGKLIVLWENVPGVLSDKTNAFGCLLGGLVGAVDAIPNPAGASWPSEGMVQGPRARAAWCVLDAQWFGVAQRRRRVFVVVDFGGACDPAQILLEPDRLRGDHPPRRETGKGAAGNSGSGASHWSGWPHPGLNQPHNTGGIGASNQEIFSQGGAGLVPSADISPALRAQSNCSFRADPEAFVAVEGHHGDIAGTVSSKWSKGSGGPAGDETQNMVAFDCKGTEVQHDASGVSPPLRSMGHLNSHQNAGGHAALAFSIMPMNSGKDYKAREVEVSQPLMAGGPVGGNQGGDFVAHASGPTVRRLTPTECARLQGFPDDHAAITYRGKPAADGNQYKAYGNSMAVPVIRYILERTTQ
tara:strand:- start:3280 stop:4701 length:1422 start_codon:yes stop_codon:yes gene_type:complete